MSLKDALDKFDMHMNAIGGCSDGYCMVRRPAGMHTNGGCRCMDNKYTAQRVGHAAQELRLAVVAELDKQEKSE